MRHLFWVIVTVMASVWGMNGGYAATPPGADLPVLGMPTDGQISLQDAATPVMQDMHDFFYFWLVPIAIFIVVLVVALMLWVLIRYNKRANPTPKTFSHNTLIEVIWTIVPVMILLVLVTPSMQLLFKQDRIPKADITVKATASQWNWEYEYPDNGDFSFVSSLLKEEDAKKQGRMYLLAVDEPLIVPAGKTVRLLVTANLVIHSWAVPSFGVKMDAIPGRINETWFRVDKPGIYYGQCSELCGKDHAYMPIEVRVLPEEDFNAWVLEKGGQINQQQASHEIKTQPSSQKVYLAGLETKEK